MLIEVANWNDLINIQEKTKRRWVTSERLVCTDSSQCPHSVSKDKGFFPVLVTRERSQHTFTKEIYALLLRTNGEDRWFFLYLLLTAFSLKWSLHQRGTFWGGIFWIPSAQNRKRRKAMCTRNWGNVKIYNLGSREKDFLNWYFLISLCVSWYLIHIICIIFNSIENKMKL